MISELIQNRKLTAQEEAIVSYIQEHPECITTNNAKELAQLTYVSSPTIIRFVQKLGFKGYLEFQLAYTQENIMFNQTRDLQLDKDSSLNDIIDVLPDVYYHVFMETKKLTKTDSFVRTINYMLQAKQIDFYANDNNYAEVQSACLKFNTIGIRAQAFNTLNTAYLENCNPSETLAFVVSHSGNNQTMVDSAYYLRKKQIRVIALTGKMDPSLELVCNESLYLDSLPHHLPFGIMLYGLSIHYIIDILYTSICLKRDKH
ncbi:MAG: MurR/RpiR family transcriptional regulator [Thomasclavelia sp.]|jgi:RpiR family carbohydrate utilization transcriptional regulator|nr:MurR/RpiR family transcriptional regulator [Thomasclavelia sp.]